MINVDMPNMLLSTICKSIWYCMNNLKILHLEILENSEHKTESVLAFL